MGSMEHLHTHESPTKSTSFMQIMTETDCHLELIKGRQHRRGGLSRRDFDLIEDIEIYRDGLLLDQATHSVCPRPPELSGAEEYACGCGGVTWHLEEGCWR